MTYTFILHPDMSREIAQALIAQGDEVIFQGEITRFDADLKIVEAGDMPKAPATQPHDWYRRYDKRRKK